MCMGKQIIYPGDFEGFEKENTSNHIKSLGHLARYNPIFMEVKRGPYIKWPKIHEQLRL